ncbi:iron-sulfur cluster-binding protein, Rieske family [Plesiocystis pacifica SIR-1]|uniref:Iron-sulfur cluster-binding protein, Rieske family n=1 Tax=Plesiocystis pacifica SIR-1 TaxID=391625 RepID=A6FZA5_9BACT|nr:aromatic ring-hydroxylating dioxygenase subunit alpha [Plesiocystis pacifica]EDM80989.1 iron-sulfur cluster-binding protein, Rieske family [Plesiocystis pacifica SIR-1]
MDDARDPAPRSEPSAEAARRHLPLAPTGNSSAARVLDDWYVVCTLRELQALGERPLATQLHGTPIVVFRNRAGEVGALLDRCPHRNVPLSDGSVDGALLRCGYHGWAFDTEGECREVPSLCGQAEGKARTVQRFACREQDGLVWVYATPEVEPVREPYVFRWMRDSAFHSGMESFEVEGTVHAVAENALDVPHTAFLHKGLFRKAGGGNEIEVVVRRWRDRAEAEYIGEPRPPGLAGRFLAPGGGVVQHFDRFVLPSITEVEYRLGERSQICTVSALTPLTATRTRLTAVISFRLPLPSAVVSPVLGPVARAIFKQDAEVLKRQVESIERFGGEAFASTELDALGPQILRLLRQAERGERGVGRDEGEPAHEHRFKMRI